MAETRTPRLNQPQWSAGTDSPSRADFNEAFLSLEQRVVGYIRSTAGTRPAATAANAGFLHDAEDTNTLTWSNGTDWISIGIGTAQGTLANRPAANGFRGVYRTTDGNGSFIDVAGTWRRIVTDEGGVIAGGQRLLFGDASASTGARVEATDTGGRDYWWVGNKNSQRTGIYAYGQTDSALPDTVEIKAASLEIARFRSSGIDLLDSDVANGKFTTVYDKTVYDGTAFSGARTADFSVASVVSNRHSGNVTYTFTWPTMTTDEMYTVCLAVWMNASSYTITWPAGTKWVAGAPTFDAIGEHLFFFTRVYMAGAWRVIGSFGGSAL